MQFHGIASGVPFLMHRIFGGQKGNAVEYVAGRDYKVPHSYVGIESRLLHTDGGKSYQVLIRGDTAEAGNLDSPDWR